MTPQDRFSAPRRVLREGVTRAYPGAVVEVGRRDGILWEEAFGVVSQDEHAPPTTLDTVFDLASLTKVLSTTVLIMIATERSRLDLDAAAAERLREWQGHDRETVTLADFLAHTSGLTAHLPFFRDHGSRAEFEWAISRLVLEYAPRTKSVYSDLGFILLGFVLEDILGDTVDRSFSQLATERFWPDIGFRPDLGMRRRCAPTEVDPWRGRRLVGEVHDENAWALGGVAGHAGLFGTATAVGRIAREVLGGLQGEDTFVRASTMRAFVLRTTIPHSTRALGWDTMQPTSSCGTRMSAKAIGHTGFTGTSLWIDPSDDVYVVLLTNRVCPTRTNNQLLAIRPAFHDAVLTALES